MGSKCNVSFAIIDVQSFAVASN